MRALRIILRMLVDNNFGSPGGSASSGDGRLVGSLLQTQNITDAVLTPDGVIQI
jgi:hypothetical protein